MTPRSPQTWFRASRTSKTARATPKRSLQLELLEDRLVPAIAGSLNQNFVAQAYLDLLGRQVDPSGLALWSGLLDQGFPRTLVALGIESSSESRVRDVETAYHNILGRDADTVGLTGGVLFLTLGGHLQQLENFLYSSPEFFQKNGGTNDGFLTGIFVDLLGRASSMGSGQPIDPVDPTNRGERLSWDMVLAGGVSRFEVATLISQGTEGAQHQVNLEYKKILGRNADETGLALFSAILPAIGTDVLDAILAGSDEYLQKVQKNPPTVPGINTTQLALTTIPTGPVSVATPVTFTATVSPARDGRYTVTSESVSFTDEANNLLGRASLDANGVAKFTTAALSAGNHTITARYAGDSNFTASSKTTTVAVGQAASTVALSSLNSVTRQSDGVSLTVAITVAAGPQTPGGTVQIEEQTTNGTQTVLTPVGRAVAVSGTPVVQNGQATLTVTPQITGLSAGTHVLVAVYSGDGNFTGNTSNSITQTVVPDSAVAPIVTVTSSTGSSSVRQTDVAVDLGQGVTFTATATPPNGVNFALQGTLTLRNGNTVLGTVDFSQTPGGMAKSQSLLLPAGDATITASYTPSAAEIQNGIYSSASASLIQTINRVTTTVTISPSGTPAAISLNGSVMVTATVSGMKTGFPFTGLVTFLLDGNTFTTASVNAQGQTSQVSIDPLNAAQSPHTITAVYNMAASGNPNFDPNYLTSAVTAASTLTQAVNKGSTSVQLSLTTEQNGDAALSISSATETLNAVVGPNNVAGTVQFTISPAVSSTRLTSTSEQITLDPTVGPYTIQVQFKSSDANFSDSPTVSYTAQFHDANTDLDSLTELRNDDDSTDYFKVT